MNNASYLGLAQNTALLLAIALIFDLTTGKLYSGKFRLNQIPVGMLLGGIGIILILTPWVFMPGIIFDTRSILLGISGLFFGTIPTLIAMLITGVFRVAQGGVGVTMGVLVILSSGGTGIAWRHLRKKTLITISGQELYVFGLVIHIIMLICTLAMPFEIAINLLKAIALPVILIYPLGTALLGLLFVSRLRRAQINQELIDEETSLKGLVDVLQAQSLNKDELLEYALKKAINITRSEYGYIYLYNEEANQFTVCSQTALFLGEHRKEVEQEWDEIGIYKQAVVQKSAVMIEKSSFQSKEVKKKLSRHMQINCFIAVPVCNQEKIEAVIALARKENKYKEADSLHLTLLMDAVWKITERQRVEKALSSIEWMLSKKINNTFSDNTNRISSPDLLSLNKEGLILHSVGEELLMDIAGDYLDLLDTSAVISEKNGDYALAVFSSGWCKFMNDASRNLSGPISTQASLSSGKWLCRESCWANASNVSITTGKASDVKCAGGLNIFSVPIFAADEVVGSINFCYGDPPKDSKIIQELAEKYQVDPQELITLANAYETRPPFIIELAKQRLLNSANLIGILIERNIAQKNLKHSESMLYRIIDILPVGLWFADKEGNLTRSNPAGKKIWGAEPLVSMSELGVFHGRYLPSKKEIKPEDWALVSSIKYGTTIEDELIEIDAFDGTQKKILNYSTPLINSDGEIEGAIIVNLDITKRVEAEEKVLQAQEELQRLLQDADQARQVLLSVIEDQKIAEEKIYQLNQELEERVRDRTTQLEVANQELEAFAYSVSHDLRAPLRAMDGFSAALLEDYPDRLDEQGRHYLARIQQASQRMGQLIEDLLHLSRVTRREIVLETVSLSMIAKDIAKELSLQNNNNQTEFIIKENLIIQADPHLIRIAMENLMNNAFKFSGNRKKAIVEVGATEQNNELVYFVKDNGVGFNMKYINKLFSPFQRLHSIEEFPGTGIGLVTVQRIINRHGGRIWPEAELEKGATFFFTLGG